MMTTTKERMEQISMVIDEKADAGHYQDESKPRHELFKILLQEQLTFFFEQLRLVFQQFHRFFQLFQAARSALCLLFGALQKLSQSIGFPLHFLHLW
jgi:hypothetical protein